MLIDDIRRTPGMRTPGKRNVGFYFFPGVRGDLSVCRRLLLRLTVVVCGLCLGWSNAHRNANADPPAAGFTVANANEVTKFTGKLKGVQRGVLMVTREDGSDVMVQPPDDISGFAFVAQAKPAFLKRGQLVRFSGTFAPNGVATAPIQKVELFQPVAAQRITGHAREKFVPGVYPADRHAPKQPVAVAKYNVVGGLLGVNSAGVMMVQAGNKNLQVQRATDVTFALRYNNLALAQEGDPVSVSGFYQPPDDTKVKAERITISPERVYGEPTDQPPKRMTRREKAKAKAEAEKAAAEKAAAAEAAAAEAAEKEGEEKVEVGGLWQHFHPSWSVWDHCVSIWANLPAVA